jgi:hypothetical protein
MIRLEGLGKLKKFYGLIVNRLHDLPACSTASQPSTLPLAPIFVTVNNYLKRIWKEAVKPKCKES